jgi:hypothetical protein
MMVQAFSNYKGIVGVNGQQTHMPPLIPYGAKNIQNETPRSNEKEKYDKEVSNDGASNVSSLNNFGFQKHS